MPTQRPNKITPKRIAETEDALERLIRTLKYFFEDLEEDIKNASHE